MLNYSTQHFEPFTFSKHCTIINKLIAASLPCEIVIWLSGSPVNKITILLIRLHIVYMCIHSNIYDLSMCNSKKVLLSEGTEPPIMNLFIAKAIQCYSNIPELWQIIWGELQEQREVCPSMEAKNLLFRWESIVVGVWLNRQKIIISASFSWEMGKKGYNRMIEWFGLEWTLNTIYLQPYSHGHRHLH